MVHRLLLLCACASRALSRRAPAGVVQTATARYATVSTRRAAVQGSAVRTRFAPSPTGSLHVGGARTALFSWLKAKQEGGSFVIRVEDTDTARSTRESEQEVLQDLRWLGLIDDEGPVTGGDKGPYRQSERMQQGMYQAFAKTLVETGHAYPCFCTAEELDAKRAAAEAAGENPQYDGTWRDADPEEVQRRLDAGEPHTIRFKVPAGKTVTIQDSVRGEVSWDVAATVGDFILLRSADGTDGSGETKGMPVYNFCVAIDDALMEVSHVIRATEHLTNTVRQALILEALEYKLPQYAHLSLVLGEDKSKLSKRHGATSIDQFRREGYLPEAMLNYLCLLGWNDQSEQEIYTIDELIDAFSLDRVTKSPAVFDVKKLNWINGQHLRALPADKRAALVGEALHELGVATSPASPFVDAASEMVAEKLELVNDAEPLVRGALSYPLADLPPDQRDEDFAEVGAALVKLYREGALPDPTSDSFAADWKAAVKQLGKDLGRKGKKLFMPLRLALTGRSFGPDVPAQLRVLAFAAEHSDCEAVPLAERIGQLEAALAELPQPAMSEA